MLKLLPLLLAACGTYVDPQSLDCSVDSDITGSATSAAGTTVVRDTLTVTGTAFHPEGRAIRSVTVGGLPASNTGFNFETWRVDLPIEQLLSLDSDADGSVALTVSAQDACDHPTPQITDPLTILVDRTPGVVVESLDLMATIPSGVSWVPADGSVAATITVTANADAADALVSMSSGGGTLAGLTDGAARLAGDGTSPATASLLFTSTTPGTALITASADGVLDSVTVLVAGPPELVPGTQPSGVYLSPGQSLPVTVWTDGEVDWCTAYGASPTDIPVTTGGATLYGAQAASDTTGDGRPDIVVGPVADLSAAASVEVYCCDRYDQCGSATYAAAPP